MRKRETTFYEATGRNFWPDELSAGTLVKIPGINPRKNTWQNPKHVLMWISGRTFEDSSPVENLRETLREISAEFLGFMLYAEENCRWNPGRNSERISTIICWKNACKKLRKKSGKAPERNCKARLETAFGRKCCRNIGRSFQRYPRRNSAKFYGKTCSAILVMIRLKSLRKSGKNLGKSRRKLN